MDIELVKLEEATACGVCNATIAPGATVYVIEGEATCDGCAGVDAEEEEC